jgi:CSLREA domain-containing protein
MRNRVLAHRRSARPSIDRRALRTTVEAIEPRRLLSTFTVNTTSDVTNPSDGLTTLREAIIAANNHTGADTINFSPTVFTSGSLHTIKLTGGQLSITDTSGATTIAGPGSNVLAVDAQQKRRVFQINGGVTTMISGVAIRNGKVVSPSTVTAMGGGVLNAGTLTLNKTTVSGNIAAGADGTRYPQPYALPGDASGGGVYSTGALTITQRFAGAGNQRPRFPRPWPSVLFAARVRNEGVMNHARRRSGRTGRGRPGSPVSGQLIVDGIQVTSSRFTGGQVSPF